MHVHTLKIVDRPGKTQVVKRIRELGFSLAKSQFFCAIPADLPLDLLRSGAVTDTCPCHHTPRKVRGAKEKPAAKPILARLWAHRESVIRRVRYHVEQLYRQAQSSWAGGETFATIAYGNTPAASGESRRVWSKNGKWSGNNAHLSLIIQPSWDKIVEPVFGLATAGGMLTTHAQQIAQDCWVASWVVQGRGFDLKVESGFIVRAVDGSWVHAKTEKAARSLAARRTPTFVERVAEKNRERESRAAYFRSLSAAELVALYPEVEVRVADSRAAGNCASGTENWVEIHFPGRTSATVAEVIGAGNGQAEYVLRAVRCALLRARVAPVQQQAAA